jgi:16S rRNA (cytidine1402-2'-O)-methyltransferase
MLPKSIVYLIPSVISENALETIPAYISESVQKCQVIFAENERTARRFLKNICKEIIIDNYEWFTIHKAEPELVNVFKERINEEKNIAIISEAGCPGIADPGQVLINVAQQMNVRVKPLVGPSSILLALMASGLNGQQFQFNGYLPISVHDKYSRLKELEEESARKKCTQIFIETPYRNNQLFESLLKVCKPATQLCIAVDITSDGEFIRTKTIAEWRKEKIDINKKPAIFLLMAGIR